MRVLNLTQYMATIDQKKEGVVEPLYKSAIKSLLTFDEEPSDEEILLRANTLAEIASDHEAASAAMIGGAQYLIAPLETALLVRGLEVWYAHTQRISVKVTLQDGSVRNASEVKYQGFVKRKPKK